MAIKICKDRTDAVRKWVIRLTLDKRRIHFQKTIKKNIYIYNKVKKIYNKETEWTNKQEINELHITQDYDKTGCELVISKVHTI